ncbi:MAG: hypothetical protein V4568_04670 [Pseudomonadota bacterium]
MGIKIASDLLKGAQLHDAPPSKLATLSLLIPSSDIKLASSVDFPPGDIAPGLNRTSQENAPGDPQNTTSLLLKEYQSRAPDHPGAALGVLRIRINTAGEPGHEVESHFLASYGGTEQQRALQKVVDELPQANITIVLVPLNSQQSNPLSKGPEGRILSYVDEALKANNKTEPDKVHGEISLASKFPFTVDCASAVEWFNTQWPNIQVVPVPALELGHFHEVADWDLSLPANDTTLAPEFTKKQIAALFGLDEANIKVESTKDTPKFSGTGMPAEDGNVYVKGITVQKRGGDITVIIKTTAKELGLDAVKPNQPIDHHSKNTKKR